MKSRDAWPKKTKIVLIDGTEKLEPTGLEGLQTFLKKFGDLFGPSRQQIDPFVTQSEVCLHKNCAGCKNGTCSGVHMLSCPCSSCSPRMM